MKWGEDDPSSRFEENADDVSSKKQNIIAVARNWFWPNWCYVDISPSFDEPAIISVTDHFKECVFEMVTFLFFIYMLKNVVNFDVFGGGPISFLIQKTVRNHRKQTTVAVEPETENETPKENVKARQNRSRSPSRIVSSSDAAKYSDDDTDNEKSALVSTWSGEDGEDETDETNLDISDVSKDSVIDPNSSSFDQVDDLQISESRECNRQAENNLSETDSNITSQLSDDQTFDDSVCESIDQVNDEVVVKIASHVEPENIQKEATESEESDYESDSDEVDSITNASWYLEYLKNRNNGISRSERAAEDDEEEDDEEILGSDDDEQEASSDYVKGGYHPVKIGDLFNNRYHVVRKLGWGHFSTVWLCWDLTEKKFVALKVVKSAAHYTETALDEIKLLKCVRDTDGTNPFRERTVQLLDDFKISGVNGTHVCMVFEVLGHNLLKFIIRSNYQGIPLTNVKIMMKQVLEGLDYLHTSCKIIHTDIKPENILVCVDESYIRRIAAEATHYHKLGLKLPGSAVSTAPEEFHRVNLPAKVAKVKKKKLKKRAKRNITIMEDALRNTEETVNIVLQDDTATLTEKFKTDLESQDTEREEKMQDESRVKFTDEVEEKKVGEREQGTETVGETRTDNFRSHEEHMKHLAELEVAAVISGKTNANKNNISMDDIEKRKSFADMKLAEFTSGSGSIEGIPGLEDDCNGHLETEDSEDSKSKGSTMSVTSPDEGESVIMNNKNAVRIPSTGSEEDMEEMKKLPMVPVLDPVNEICLDLEVKIADLGNACWVHHHFTEDIQTRQYRSLEVLLGAGYGPAADIWSTACMAFEMATGDYLFEPHSGDDYTRDEDHLAHIIELVGAIPRNIAFSGKYSKEFFKKNGELRHINKLKPWPLYDVLTEKYEWDPQTAKEFADFLIPMLAFDPKERATARESLQHPFVANI